MVAVVNQRTIYVESPGGAIPYDPGITGQAYGRGNKKWLQMVSSDLSIDIQVTATTIDIKVPPGGGLGTVTSVGLVAPADLFTVTNSPVNTAGDLTFSYRSDIAAGAVLIGPTGAAGTPTMRRLEVLDLPVIGLDDLSDVTIGTPDTSADGTLRVLADHNTDGTLTLVNWTPPTGGGTVTSVDMSVPSWFTIGGNPVTGSGTLALGLQSIAQNLVIASPDGTTGLPAPRALVEADIPNLEFSKLVNIAQDRILGRISTGTGAAETLTAAQAKQILALENVQNVDTTNASNISSGTLADARLSSNVTLAGNTFNTSDNLVQLSSGLILDNLISTAIARVSQIPTGIDDFPEVTIGTPAPSSVATLRVLGDLNTDGTFTVIDWSPPSGGGGLTSAYTSVSDGTNTASASGASDLRYNTANNLLGIVVTDGSPDSITFTVNQTNFAFTGEQITSGTVADARLTANVTLQGNTFNTGNNLVQLSSGLIPDGLLSTNVARTNAANTFTESQTISVAAAISQLVLDSGTSEVEFFLKPGNGTANQRAFDFQVTGGALNILATNDVGGAPTSRLTLNHQSSVVGIAGITLDPTSTGSSSASTLRVMADVGPNGTFEAIDWTPPAGGGGLTSAYTSVSDGTNTINASGSATLELTSADNLLTILATEGSPDNVLYTVNQGNFALAGSQITSGTIADGRLSANVPLLNANNTFTQTQNLSGSGAINLNLTSSDNTVANRFLPGNGTVNQRAFSINANAGQFLVQATTDAFASPISKLALNHQTNVWSVAGKTFDFDATPAATSAASLRILADPNTDGTYEEYEWNPTENLVLSDISDTAITAPTKDQVLAYDGTSDWTNQNFLKPVGDQIPNTTYEIGNFAHDAGYWGYAVTQTAQPLAPTPVGSPRWTDYEDDQPPTWTVNAETGSALFCVYRIVSTTSLNQLLELSYYVPDVTGDYGYRFFWVSDPTGNRNIIPVIPKYIPSGGDAERFLNFSVNAMVPAGTSFDLVLVITRETAASTFNYNWNYATSFTGIDPVSGEATQGTFLSTETLRVHHFDDGATDRSSDLTSVVPGSTLTVTQASVSTDFGIVSVTSETSHVEYELPDGTTVASNGTVNLAWSVPASGTINNYVDTGKYSGEPLISTGFSTVSYDAVTPTGDDGYFGIRLRIQEYEASPDWRIVTAPGDNSLGGGGGIPEAPTTANKGYLRGEADWQEHDLKDTSIPSTSGNVTIEQGTNHQVLFSHTMDENATLVMNGTNMGRSGQGLIIGDGTLSYTLTFPTGDRAFPDGQFDNPLTVGVNEYWNLYWVEYEELPGVRFWTQAKASAPFS